MKEQKNYSVGSTGNNTGGNGNKRPSPVAASEGTTLSSSLVSSPQSCEGSTGSSSKRTKLADNMKEVLVVAQKQTEQGQQQQPIIGQFLDEDDNDDTASQTAASHISSPPTTGNKDEEHQLQPHTDECPGSSVKQLKGWLSDFERKQKEHYERNNSHTAGTSNTSFSTSSSGKMMQNHQLSSATPTKRICMAAPTPAPTPVQEGPRSSSASNAEAMLAAASQQALKFHGHTIPGTPSKPSALPSVAQRSSSITKSSPALPSAAAAVAGSTPGRTRFGKPVRSKDEDVQATNDGYASVSKLSAWLEDDPTQKHKGGLPIAHRRGPKVSMRSRKFEPMPLNDATRTVEFRKNGVNERKQWLQSAFKKDEEKAEGTKKDGISVADRAKFFQTAFTSKEVGEKMVRKDDDGHTNVRLAEVGDEEELCSSGMCNVSQYHLSEESPVRCHDHNDNRSVESASTCAGSCSFSIGKQMLEDRTARNSMKDGPPVIADEVDGSSNASVQSRKMEFERKEQEVTEPVRANVKAHWEADSTSHTYTKKIVPEEGPRFTPAKKLSDLP